MLFRKNTKLLNKIITNCIIPLVESSLIFAPKPKPLGLGSEIRTLTGFVAFLPIPIPSFQPHPFKNAMPNSSIGILV